MRPSMALKSLASGAIALLLAAGAAAVAYGRWSDPIAEGDRAVADGQLDRALASYARAERRFDRVSPAKQLFARDYDRTIANELWALYRLGRFDDTIEKADRAPDGADPHYWAGCAYFEKAIAEEKAEARL